MSYLKECKTILHTGEGSNGITHLNLWIPIFRQSGIKFIVVVRNKKVFHYFQKSDKSVPIVFAKRDRHIRYFFEYANNIRACFYPSNTMKNKAILMKNEIKHIFIGHGDSDKTASAHKFFRVYDQNWVAGEAHIDRFDNAGFDHVGLEHIKVGRPNLKETLLLTQKKWIERYGGNINLLYLSTWEGFLLEHEYTSVEVIKGFFERIKKYEQIKNIEIKLHPGIGKRKKELVNISSEIEDALQGTGMKYTIHPKQTPVEELIKKSNVFICDISAVVSESLAGNGPIFVYLPKDKPIQILKSKMSFEDYTYVFSSIDELHRKFQEVVVGGNDYLAENREKAMEYILGKTETLENRFIQSLKMVENES